MNFAAFIEPFFLKLGHMAYTQYAHVEYLKYEEEDFN